MSRSRSPTSRSASPRKRLSSLELEKDNSCPFLIRLYISKGRHTPLSEFDEGKFPLRDEFSVYGWKSSTPSSLIQLLLPAFPPTYRSPIARFSFRHIYVDASARGLYRSKDLVSFTGREMDGEVSEKSLDDYGFVAGDLLSVSLFVPEPKVPRLNAQSGQKPSFGWEKAEGNGEKPVEDGAWSRGESLPIRGRGDGWRGRGNGRESFGREGRGRGGGRESVGDRGGRQSFGERGGRDRSRSPKPKEDFGGW